MGAGSRKRSRVGSQKNSTMRNLIICLVLIVAASCSKSDLDDVSNPNLSNAKTGGMEYGPVSCDLPNGECGSQCAGNDGGCWTQTECKANSRWYLDVLESKYTPQQIYLMSINSTPITDAELLQILKREGKLPLK